MPTLHELILPEERRATCDCALCEQGRFIKRLVALLPESEANELNDWYNALIDTEERRSMTLASLCETLEIATQRVKELRAND